MSTSSHRPSFLSTIGGTLVSALIIVSLDVALDGNYMFSAIVCPIWLIVGVVRAVLQRPRWSVAAARVLIPVFTGLLAVANYHLQTTIAMGNAAHVIQACERYREVNGSYPQHLDQLVPRYLSTVPRAKYCCLKSEFGYSGSPGAILRWYAFPPFGRWAYRFQTGDWRYID